MCGIAGTYLWPNGGPLTEQLTRIVHDAPHHRNQLILLLQQHEVTAPLARMVQGAGLEQLFTGLEGFVVSSAPQALLSLGWAVLSGWAVSPGWAVLPGRTLSPGSTS